MSDEPRSGADRNLLFGVLALQMDFIDRDSLIAAMNAWAIDKVQPIGNLLVARGALSPERRSLLDALVTEHLKQHKGLAHSISTLGFAPAIRTELESIHDRDLRDSLSSVFPPTPPAPDRLVGEATSGGRRFHVLRLHARGGLGEVSVALDRELHREVAVKEIQAPFADNAESQSRFLLEAEITGRLEHPGIVPVYGLGRHPDGRPYYAMRLIHGESLEEGIRRFHESAAQAEGARALELRRLLGHFVAVCNAIAYAHSRGVIHRDLKPANVMLGAYGETLVVDWGLAKAMEERPEELPRPAEGTLRPHLSGSDRTQTGAVMGTPAYMSPEQAGGRSDQVGPASDVYSLGATLYALIVGRPPFEGTDVVPLLEGVVRGDFPPPRRANSTVPLELEAICLKAMALRPSERYASPSDLAGDVERWLADEPVRAYREPFRARLGRWARRHRPLVAGGGALLLTAVLALAVGVLLLGRTQRETDRQRRLAEDGATRAVALQHEADQSTRTARLQRARALRTVQVLLDSQLRLPEDEGRPLHRELLLYLRRDLLDKAIAELEEMARRPETAAEANQYRARAHLAMGDTLVLAGKQDEARASYERGRELADEMRRGSPKGEARWSLCLALQKLGGLSLENNNLAPAARSLGEALALAEELAGEDRTNRRALNNLRACSLQYGRVKLQQGDVASALHAAEKALRNATRLEEYAGPRVLPDKSVCYSLLGDTYLRQDNLPAARIAYKSALNIDKVYHGFNPDSDEARRNLTVSHEKLGDLALRQGQTAEARLNYTAALGLQEKLARAVPDNGRAQLALAEAQVKQAKLELDPDKALAGFEQALKAWQRFEKEGRLKGKARQAKLAELKAGMEESKVGVRAVGDLKFALGHPRAAELLVTRARALAQRGKLPEAAETAGKLAALPGARGGHHYPAACCFALCAAGVTGEELTEEEQAQRDGYVQKALEQLRLAATAGHFKAAERVALLRREPDLMALRTHPGFAKLLAELEAKP